MKPAVEFVVSSGERRDSDPTEKLEVRARREWSSGIMPKAAQVEVQISEGPARDDAELLAESVESVTKASRFALWQVVDLFPELNTAHWAAYAEKVGLPPPSTGVICRAMKLYMRKVGYWGRYSHWKDE